MRGIVSEIAAGREAASGATAAFVDRSGLLAALFKETDRAQRMKTALSVLLMSLDAFDEVRAELGEALVQQAMLRASRPLRSYDLLGRLGGGGFAVILPGCGRWDAAMLAERLRVEVFAKAFAMDDRAFPGLKGETRGTEVLGGLEGTIRLTACFGIAGSGGRSAGVVLREAEKALQTAQGKGPGTIECFVRSAQVGVAAGRQEVTRSASVERNS